ncbi:unnamed protein product [Ambrosiozyma monospora]|uniref:Unnamed protein product n=1 Tax=Ambrosiozyma monospora TaxID=43982 RepID=A0ACB5T998_AMBMO|nr:unnamed protein product [Ambrosiozyma monospora]
MKWATVLGKHLGVSVHEKWNDVMKNMYLPVSNDNVTLEFDTMNSTVAIKQADVVLISYIDDLDDALVSNFDYTQQRAYRDLLYYSEHQSSQGPAMTFPVFNAVTQKLNNVGCGSQTYLAKSVEPFLRFPFAQMSEQNNDDYDTNGGTHPAFPFLTGHGGILQSYLYGLTGLRFSYNVSEDGSINRILDFDPTDLPLLEGDLHIYDFKYLNQSLDISIGSVNATIYHKGDSPITIFVSDRNPESGYYVVQPGSYLNIPVFITEDNFEDSITECAASPYQISEGMHGDVVESIIDGDNSTKWQAENKDVLARVVVDLNSFESISKGHIVWGTRPAARFSVSLIEDVEFIDETYISNLYLSENSTQFNITTVLDKQQVDISSPFDPSTVEVKVYPANYTLFDFGASFTARYVILDIEGVLDKDESKSGGQVAELALFA